MKQTSVSLLLGVAFAVSLSGCGGATPESLAKESTGQMNELATVLENAKSVDEAKPKLDPIVAKLSDLKKRYDALKLSEERKKEIDATVKPDMEKAASRLMTAMMKLATTDPQGMPKLGEMMQKIATK
jgi:hypothetical protein